MIEDFAVPVDDRVKLKECEKKKYLSVAWEIPGRMETFQTTALLRSARILRRFLVTWEDLLSLKLQWKLSANANVKHFKE